MLASRVGDLVQVVIYSFELKCCASGGNHHSLVWGLSALRFLRTSAGRHARSCHMDEQRSESTNLLV